MQTYEEGFSVFGAESSLIVDRETGVTYLVVCNSYGTGITPLPDSEGKPGDDRFSQSEKPG